MGLIAKIVVAVVFGVALASCSGSSRVGGILSPGTPQPELNESSPQTETKRLTDTKHARKRPESPRSTGTQVSGSANRPEVNSASAGEE
jgi:hypothetical protein